MDAIENILTRESVRDYLDKEISNEDLNTILKCAMAGPSCKNLRDYAFIVINDKKKLVEIYKELGPQSKPLLNANMAIAVIADNTRAFEKAKDYKWIDTTIACQNIMLACNALNIGTCMLGVYPQMDRVNNLSNYFNLPNEFLVCSIIALGYKKDKKNGKNHFEQDRIHINKW